MIIDKSNAHEYVKNNVMDISDREVTELKYIPPNVTKLYCNHNELTTLPELPNIISLFCINNQLTTFPELPNIISLFCNDNELTTLPELPNVETLHCSINNLTTLPELTNINSLFCGSNQLTKLPEIPNVVALFCVDNQLTTLPELPNVTTLRCSDNNFDLFEIFSNKNRTLNELELIANSIESKPFTTAVNMLKQGKRFSQVRLWLQDALIDSGEWRK